MAVEIKKFVRKPFNVEAVEVNESNINQVAQWCKGTVLLEPGRGANRRRYIKVDVKRPLEERQTRAYVGDYVVVASDPNIKGFKVYTPDAFAKTYAELVKVMEAVFDRMSKRVEEEERHEEQDLGPVEELRLSNKHQS